MHDNDCRAFLLSSSASIKLFALSTHVVKHNKIGVGFGRGGWWWVSVVSWLWLCWKILVMAMLICAVSSVITMNSKFDCFWTTLQQIEDTVTKSFDTSMSIGKSNCNSQYIINRPLINTSNSLKSVSPWLCWFTVNHYLFFSDQVECDLQHGMFFGVRVHGSWYLMHSSFLAFVCPLSLMASKKTWTYFYGNWCYRWSHDRRNSKLDWNWRSILYVTL
jgi:hypothetical protein